MGLWFFCYITEQKKPPEQNVGPITTLCKVGKSNKICLLQFFPTQVSNKKKETATTGVHLEIILSFFE